jgi:hypothetical protein
VGPAFKSNYTLPNLNATSVYNVLAKIYREIGAPNNGTDDLPIFAGNSSALN